VVVGWVDLWREGGREGYTEGGRRDVHREGGGGGRGTHDAVQDGDNDRWVVDEVKLSLLSSVCLGGWSVAACTGSRKAEKPNHTPSFSVTSCDYATLDPKPKKKNSQKTGGSH
jgi:hypothetical protein